MFRCLAFKLYLHSGLPRDSTSVLLIHKTVVANVSHQVSNASSLLEALCKGEGAVYDWSSAKKQHEFTKILGWLPQASEEMISPVWKCT